MSMVGRTESRCTTHLSIHSLVQIYDPFEFIHRRVERYTKYPNIDTNPTSHTNPPHELNILE